MAAISPECGANHDGGMARSAIERGVGLRVASERNQRAGGGGRSIWIVDSIHKVRQRPYGLFRLSSGERVGSAHCRGGVRVAERPDQPAVEVVVVLERRSARVAAVG